MDPTFEYLDLENTIRDDSENYFDNLAVASATISKTLGRIDPASATPLHSNLPPSKDYVSIGCSAINGEGEKEEKKTFKARTIVFTCYDKDALDDPEAWLRNLQKQCSWTLGQLERCPTTGRIHIQGMAFSGKEASRWGFLKGTNTWKRACIDPLKSIEYCSKTETKLEGPWEFGERPVYGQKNKSMAAAEARKEKSLKILETDIQDLIRTGDLGWNEYTKAKLFKTTFLADEKIIAQNKLAIDHTMTHEWIYGQTGTGKTTMARTKYPDHYLKNKNKWWDNYAGEETVIIEDLGKSDATWIGDKLKEWADKWPFKAEIKGGQIEIRPKRIVVTSNYRIEDLWDDQNIIDPLLRRFNIINL